MTTRNSRSELAHLSERVQQRCRALLRQRAAAAYCRWMQYARAVGVATDRPVMADLWAQAEECARVAWQRTAPSPEHAAGILRAASPLVQSLLADVSAEDAEPRSQAAVGADDALLFVEAFIAHHHAARRSRHGVYYTPPALARAVVRRVHRFLQREFRLPLGLADPRPWRMLPGLVRSSLPAGVDPETPFVQIVDPAVGTGIFLAEVIECVYAEMQQHWSGRTAAARRAAWDRYVAVDLLPRLIGVELCPAALAAAHLHLCGRLWATGFSFRPPARIQLAWGDSLGPAGALAHVEPLVRDQWQEARRLIEMPRSVVIGNPPYSGISHNKAAWLQDLLRGSQPDGTRAASYYEVDGAPLQERKHWLQDDYVKFMRWAQWHVERLQCGIVALVTNHGYLDNPTFRGMRCQLLNTFPRIDVLDLHGNRKKEEVAPDGAPDENVFSIEQGTAICFMRRPFDAPRRRVRYAELWGSRSDKLHRLAQTVPARGQRVVPAAPLYLLVARSTRGKADYEAGIPLPEAMPLNSTAVVTARDPFVIDVDREKLLERLRRFADLRISDDDIRRQYFRTSRSTLYPPGDTRGWKLSQARRRMAATPDWEHAIRPCAYRPFDRRYIFWCDWMIDWPRKAVMQHLAQPGNRALITRRQMLPARPCTFFWITDTIAIDGIVRSDNRGSESVFPLYVAGDGTRQANFASSFIEQLQAQLTWEWLPTGAGDLQHHFGPDDVLHYIYGLFHCAEYRQANAPALRVDFPRIPLPADRAQFRRLCRHGAALALWHLDPATAPPVSFHGSGPPAGNRRAAYQQGSVRLPDGRYWGPVAEAAWQFRVGGHQVARKWLRDRGGEEINETSIQQYCHVLGALAATQAQMNRFALIS